MSVDPSANRAASIFEIDPWVDARKLAPVFARTGRIHIPRVLAAAGAAAMHRHLSQELPWSLVVHDGERVREAKPELRRQFGEELEQNLRNEAYGSAANRFQFLYEYCSVAPARSDVPSALLTQFLEFLNSPPFIRFARELTGLAAIAWADGQATRYRAGHFLTAHDDSAANQQREAAYVFNFTPTWKADWGGLLQFIDGDGHIAEAYTPRFNALNIFTVPQLHCVSAVAPFAPAARYSITGWLRAR
jgi:Rps23 Pro-64 3,4-dihydroxylase Tpa1-like proline 4-hydroxylase